MLEREKGKILPPPFLSFVGGEEFDLFFPDSLEEGEEMEEEEEEEEEEVEVEVEAEEEKEEVENPPDEDPKRLEEFLREEESFLFWIVSLICSIAIFVNKLSLNNNSHA